MRKRKLPSNLILQKLYWQDKLSLSEISRQYNVTTSSVRQVMQRAQIPRRSRKESINLCIKSGKRKKRPTLAKLKSIIRCRKCWFVYKNIKKEIISQCPNCDNKIDIRDRKEWAKKYLEKYPEKLQKLKNWKKLYGKKYKNKSGQNLRKSVLFVVGDKNPKCNYCGCDDIRLLEINHKLGGGAKEFKKIGAKFYWNIIQFKRDTKDLEIACRVCNALHYLTLKYGKLSFKITYQSNHTRS